MPTTGWVKVEVDAVGDGAGAGAGTGAGAGVGAGVGVAIGVAVGATGADVVREVSGTGMISSCPMRTLKSAPRPFHDASAVTDTL